MLSTKSNTLAKTLCGANFEHRGIKALYSTLLWLIGL